MEAGHFTEDGHYVERGFGEDAWLADLDEKSAMVLGGVRSDRDKKEKKQQQQQQQQQEEEPEQKMTMGHVLRMLGELGALLKDERETVTQALKRLAELRRQSRPKKSAAGQRDEDGFLKPSVAKKDRANNNDSDEFGRATRLADALLAAGVHGVYSARRTDLEDAADNRKRAAKLWEYIIRGGEGGADSKTFGPFSTAEMCAWAEQGYFANDNVEARSIMGPKRGRWRKAAGIDFDQELMEMK
jgi:hypothetical protein